MRTAVIGAGRMGRRHATIVRDLGFPLVGVCDTSAEVLQTAARECAVPAGALHTDPVAMLRAERPECVIVATTAPGHCDLTCIAAESGARFVLCEKPMAVSLAQCDRMIETCRRCGTRLAVNHQARFAPVFARPKAILASPEFGGMRSMTVVVGNFGLAMNATHQFEVFRFLSDEAPSEVSAWFFPDRQPNPRGPQFEDRAGCIRLATPGGIRFYLDASSDQGHGFQTLYAGRFGQIAADNHSGVLKCSARLPFDRMLPSNRFLTPARADTIECGAIDTSAATAAALRALIAGENFPQGEEGRLAVEILATAHHSHEHGGLAVPLGSPLVDRNRIYPWA